MTTANDHPPRHQDRGVARDGLGRYHTPPADVLERELDVLRLKRAGLTFDEIAVQVGFYDRKGAQRAYWRALNRDHREPVAETIELEKGRLDDLQAAVWPRAMKGHPDSVRAALRIMERRAKLLGLDHSDGVAERLVQLEADKVRIMGVAMVATLAGIGLTPEQADAARALMFVKMRELAGGGMPDLDDDPDDRHDDSNDQETA